MKPRKPRAVDRLAVHAVATGAATLGPEVSVQYHSLDNCEYAVRVGRTIAEEVRNTINNALANPSNALRIWARY